MLIQRLANKHAKGQMLNYIIGFLIFFLFLHWIPNMLSVFLPASMLDYMTIPEGFDRENFADYPIVVAFYAIAFEGALMLGQALYVLTFIRNKSCEYGSLFEGFQFFFKALIMTIVQDLIIMMWTLLFIIPGIIAWYGFRQSYFILADNPNKGIMQCLAESKARMTGNKMNLFKLDLTYVPYILVALAPKFIVPYFGLSSTTVAGMLLLIVADIPVAIANAYMYLGRGAFYELLISHGFANFKYFNQDVFRNNAGEY